MKLKTKPDIMGTLRAMKLNEAIEIPHSIAKTSGVRAATQRILIYKYKVSEVGVNNGCIVTRIK